MVSNRQQLKSAQHRTLALIIVGHDAKLRPVGSAGSIAAQAPQMRARKACSGEGAKPGVCVTERLDKRSPSSAVQERAAKKLNVQPRS